MPAAVSREKGFSMVEVLLAMMLLVMIVTVRLSAGTGDAVLHV